MIPSPACGGGQGWGRSSKFCKYYYIVVSRLVFVSNVGYAGGSPAATYLSCAAKKGKPTMAAPTEPPLRGFLRYSKRRVAAEIVRARSTRGLRTVANIPRRLCVTRRFRKGENINTQTQELHRAALPRGAVTNEQGGLNHRWENLWIEWRTLKEPRSRRLESGQEAPEVVHCRHSPMRTASDHGSGCHKVRDHYVRECGVA